MAALDHPGLVSVLDAGVDDDVPYLVMDFVEGASFAAFCRGRRVAGAPGRPTSGPSSPRCCPTCTRTASSTAT